MVRLLLVLMIAAAVCACAPVRPGIANGSADTHDAFADCRAGCAKRLAEPDVLAVVDFDLDALLRGAPF